MNVSYASRTKFATAARTFQIIARPKLKLMAGTGLVAAPVAKALAGIITGAGGQGPLLRRLHGNVPGHSTSRTSGNVNNQCKGAFHLVRTHLGVGEVGGGGGVKPPLHFRVQKRTNGAEKRTIGAEKRKSGKKWCREEKKWCGEEKNFGPWSV